MKVLYQQHSLITRPAVIRRFANLKLFRELTFLDADRHLIKKYFTRLALQVGRRGILLTMFNGEQENDEQLIAATAISRCRFQPEAIVHFYWIAFRYQGRWRSEIRYRLIRYAIEWLQLFGQDFSRVSFPVLEQLLDKHLLAMPDLTPDYLNRDISWLCLPNDELCSVLAKYYLDADKLKMSA